jgi:adenosine deaminase
MGRAPLNSQFSTLNSQFLADCHLHFEGCLPVATVERLAEKVRHPFAARRVFEERRLAVSSVQRFLELYADVCRLFTGPDDYREAARDVARALAADGVRYAEIYVSPEIFARVGLEAAACLEAVAHGFEEGAAAGGARCAILLDTVRHWGPESAERVLDLYEKTPLSSIVGFGMGGDENAIPAAEFSGAYARARALGLKTSVHAGEWGGAQSVREALDSLRPDRLDHGIAAVGDPGLLARLAEEGTVLCVAPTGNVATGAVADFAQHPLPRLLGAGVRAALSADDPLLFATTTAREYRRVGGQMGLGQDLLRRLAENAWRAAFCSQSVREEGLAALDAWPPLGPPADSPTSS